ncbi:MAG: DEAD/DEAH box helicase [Gordonia sp. (in: high G+C Gram-positive bacteria)]
MAELLPLAQAETIQASLLDYLSTTFALSEPDARNVLDDFLQDPDTGMFRGPYLRLRMPFNRAQDGWRGALEWYEGFPPYQHQAAAFHRLSSYNLDDTKTRPLPTVVTTGTGSGKTESFLYPILDHVQRAKRNGVTGTKALILYPMNALANDQAGRLAELITTHDRLSGVTAALYVGDAGPQRSVVSEEGLITSREIIRDTAPDIVLTNYKMLDQLLLRSADAPLWEQSATSLQYLVLDEFHTYDGAQGTDVSMLLRRLGLALKSHWADDDPAVTDADRRRPLGKITPVATSATLGDGDDPSTMLDFAHTVFGDEFGPDAVVTETRVPSKQWTAGAFGRVAANKIMPVDARVAAYSLAGSPPTDGDPAAVTQAVLTALYSGNDNRIIAAVADDDPLVLDLVKAHGLFIDLIQQASSACSLDELTGDAMTPSRIEALDEVNADDRRAVLSSLLTVLSHVRAVYGRGAVSVEAHLWVRELTRVDRRVSAVPKFAWTDDGIVLGAGESEDAFLPALYCRHCNASGWGIALAPTGTSLDSDDTKIRARSAARDDRFRALIHAPNEALRADLGESDGEPPTTDTRFGWLVMSDRAVTFTRPDDGLLAEGGAVPVLMRTPETGAEDDKGDYSLCPSCRQRDGIRFMGAAIATMLSVSLSTLFGTPSLDAREKRSLVFTDSVQDAAHRAGFVQARSHALTLRTLIQEALADGVTDVESLVRRMLDLAGDDANARYRLLPPELAARSDYTAFWQAKSRSDVPMSLTKDVRHRLLLDVEMEVGLRSGVGRTLERTGSAVATVDVATGKLRVIGQKALEVPTQGTIPRDALAYTDDDVVRWVRGVLVHMRERGAIDHPWFARFRQSDGERWWVTGGRLSSEGMPGFGAGNSAPGYPSTLAKNDFEPIASPRGWYALWAKKCLRVPATDGAALSRELFNQLAKHAVVGETTTDSKNTAYHLSPESIAVRAVDDSELGTPGIALTCAVCRASTHDFPETIAQLGGGPCLNVRCTGTLQPLTVGDNFYRQMYRGTDVRRVVAREHTSLLDDEVRREYETEFKQTEPAPNAPNVLVATPTLEMGIDIGDLSAVMLASLPRTVASYLQRIGRAGRLTGNALALAFVTGQGTQLPRFRDPLATINGAVGAPATYLSAEEILRRQYIASIADGLARRDDVVSPRTTPDALARSDTKSYLGQLIAAAESGGADQVDAFVAAFPPLNDDVVDRLKAFVTPQSETGSSEFAQRCHRASHDWNRRLELLQIRYNAVLEVEPVLAKKAQSPAATSDDESQWRDAKATARMLKRAMSEERSQHWVSSMEAAGLLPNYTLLDDTVELSVAVNWRDPETFEYTGTEFELKRGASQALREFAPGSMFYAHGFEIAVDAVDLGHDQEDVQEWACCARCGYVKVLDTTAGDTPPAACPRCKSGSIGDMGQRMQVVELRNVSAVIRRDKATIDDRSDERRISTNSIVMAADIDPEKVSRRWFVDGFGFGAKHLRDVDLRWLNLGRNSGGSSPLHVAGIELKPSYFRVCTACGKQDTATGSNLPSEHRAWCPLRTAAEESTVDIALARTMRTEAVVVRLPGAITLGDSFALPSLSAALKLGLQRRIGGAPDHLHIAAISDPSDGGGDLPALIVHDVVPGGTGYLADLTDPESVWTILRKAWEAVRDCDCQHDGKLACERCLLPHAAPGQVKHTSRSAAELHLRTLLAGGEVPSDDDVPEAMAWALTEDEPVVEEFESDLEKRFRVAFRKRLEALGATIQEEPSNTGTVWKIKLSSGQRWTMRPQEQVHGCKPDFVLVSSQGGVPPTAIFTDGWKYHASPSINRIADDAEKRRNLRDAGYQVLSFTRNDVDGDVLVSDSGIEHVLKQTLARVGDQISKSVLGLAYGNGLDILVAWVQNPNREVRESLATWIPGTEIMRMGSPDVVVGDLPATQAALDTLDGNRASADQKKVFVWKKPSESHAIAMRIGAHHSGLAEITDLAVILDDDESMLSPENRDSWRSWLRWSNLLNFRSTPFTISSRKHLASASMTAGDDLGDFTSLEPTTEAADIAPVDSGDVSEAWSEAIDDADSADIHALRILAAAGLPDPAVGEEAAGFLVDVSWTAARIVGATSSLDEDEVTGLTDAGWTVVPLEVDAVRNAIEGKNA